MKSVFVIRLLLATVPLAPFALGHTEQDAPKGAKALFYDATSTAKVVPTSAKSDVPSPSARRDSQGVSPSPGQKAFGLCYWLELVHPQGGAPVRVTEQRMFRSGERIRLHFQSNVDGRIRLLQLGSSGTATLLFPDPEKGLGNDLLRAGEDRILPAESAWFRFDNNPGTEELLLFFARETEQLPSSIKPQMDKESTRHIVDVAETISGSKDLVVEVDAAPPGPGADARTPISPSSASGASFVVNRDGQQPIVIKIHLKHQ